MKILLATRNKHKVKEITKELKELNIEVISLDEIDPERKLKITEDGNTFLENARKKAWEVYNFIAPTSRLEFFIVSDDSGLEIDALGGKPGVHSARYAGENSTQAQLIQKVLQELAEVKDIEKRTARFISVITLITPEGKEYVVEGKVEGKIIFEPRGTNGFGYDPIFVPSGYDKTFAEMDMEEKNKISHRGLAVKRLKELLKELLENRK